MNHCLPPRASALFADLRVFAVKQFRVISPIATALLTAACIDLVPVQPPRSRPAALSVSIQLPDEVAAKASGMASVTGSLDPGVERSGVARRVMSDTLRVMEQQVPTSSADGSIDRLYSGDLFFHFETRLSDGIPIEPPSVEGTVGVPVTLHWPVAMRVGPENVTISGDSALVLRLEFDRRHGFPRPESRRWSVTLFQGGQYVSRGGEGLPPDEIVFPVDRLGPLGTALTAVVNLNQVGEIPAEDGEYTVQAEVSQRVRWRVARRPTPKAPLLVGIAQDRETSPGT